VLGTKNNHRVIVARGTTDAGNPAEIAYADVTVMGTVTWVHVNVGSTNGEYITKLLWPDYRHLYATTNLGLVYTSTDGGATWTAVLTATDQLNDISAQTYGENAGVIWVVGDSNLIYMSEDFGQTWSAITAPTGGAGDDNDTVAMTPDGTVYIGNNAGEMYGSYDQGLSWTTLSAQGVVATAIKSIRAWGDFVIWVALNTAAGGRVVRSVDGGATFRLWSLNIPTNAGLNTLVVVDPNIVFVGGEPQGSTGFISKTKSQLLGV
jgi:photosystem II stability/assembly factor-like uncharacterized protein